MSNRKAPESIQAQVRADLFERERLGIARYGTALYPHNGRDALRDAYEEALDMCQYLKQALVEKGAAKAPLRTRAAVDAEIAETCRSYHRAEPPGITDKATGLFRILDRLCSEPITTDEEKGCSEAEAIAGLKRKWGA